MHWEKMNVVQKPFPTPTAVMMRAMTVLTAAFSADAARKRRRVRDREVKFRSDAAQDGLLFEIN